MFYRLQNQTNIANFHIGYNIISEIWLLVFLTNEFFDFIDTKMSCKRFVQMLTNKFGLNNFN